MSLLLDALRKSESRRRLGQAPGLELPGIPVSPRRPGRGPWLLVPLLLVLAAAGIATWWWWPEATRQDGPAVAMEDPESPGQQTDVQPPRPVPQEPSSGSEPGEGRGEPEAPAAVPENDPREATADTDEPVTGSADVEPEPEPEPGARPAGESASPPAADERAGGAERVESGDGAAGAESGSEPESGAEPDTGAEAEPVPEAEPEAQAETGGDAGDDSDRIDRGAVAEHLQIWELPRNVREDLPPLDLSINVYSERPESRFALINGERFQEGDAVAPGVVIHRITRDGAVLDFRDYRFLLD